MRTLMYEIDETGFDDPNATNVVTNNLGNALCFSRSRSSSTTYPKTPVV